VDPKRELDWCIVDYHGDTSIETCVYRSRQKISQELSSRFGLASHIFNGLITPETLLKLYETRPTSSLVPDHWRRRLHINGLPQASQTSLAS